MKFLFDESLASPEIISCAYANGYTRSSSVFTLGLTSADDDTVKEFSVSNDWVVVTRNVKHFVPLYKKLSSHPGLVCPKYQSHTDKYGQVDYFQRVLDEIQVQGLKNLKSKLVVATSALVTIRDLP